MHIYILLFDHKVPTYGLLIMLGIVIANLIALLYVMRKYENDSLEDFLILEAYTFLGAFAGAKILYLIISCKIISWSKMLDIAYFSSIMQSGFVFYGGLIGGIIGLSLGGKIHGMDVRAYLEHYVFLIPLIHCFGRIGCYEAGCCYGIPYSGWGSVIFPENSFAPAGISLLPVQLIEAAFLMMLAAVILFLQICIHWKYTTEVYLISYGIMRFVLEFFRFDQERGRWGIFSVSQVISLFLVVGSILAFEKHKNILLNESV